MSDAKTATQDDALPLDSAQVREEAVLPTQSTSVAQALPSRDVMRVPEDAGRHRAGIRQILGRIPDNWGRQLRCQKGWYSILVELDQRLAQLDPDYVVYQAKEKFGGLRYYIEIGGEVPIVEPSYPSQGTEEEKAQWSTDHESWGERRRAWFEDTPEGQALIKLRGEANALINEAESRSAHTCELCGTEGEICTSGGQWKIYQTLCPSCAEEKHFAPA